MWCAVRTAEGLWYTIQDPQCTGAYDPYSPYRRKYKYKLTRANDPFVCNLTTLVLHARHGAQTEHVLILILNTDYERINSLNACSVLINFGLICEKSSTLIILAGA